MTSTSSSFTPPRSADPEGFGQVVTLQKRIQKIMHDYKEGVSIFSELIQNADDAGAKRIEFIVDWREHKHEWDIFAGAGLLVFNDAPFTADDFVGIQKIDEGGKGKSLHKTGRFGVGFNTVYNLTDYPSIIGGSYLAWLDPHQDYATGPKPGDRWRLKDLAEEEWMSIYEVGHFRRKITNFKDKTLFRFPFRTSKQANKNKKRGHFGTEAVTRNNNIKPLLNLLKQAGEELLIFLKSILEIKVREIEADGTEKVLLHIQTLNCDEVNQAHQKILNYPADQSVLNDQCKTDPSQLPVVSYRHTIKTDTSRPTRSTWRVVHRIGVDPEGQLIEVMEQLEALQEKAVPWGAAAARIASDRSNQIQGKQYCFLPLPKTTGLPIHIHGYWDLDSARRSSTDDEGTGSAKTRSKWNELLAKKVVAIACADLMRDLVEDVGQKNPSQFYALWPLSPAQGISDFKIPFLKAVHQYPVIHSNLGKWVLPTEIYELPPNEQALFEPLTADGVPMASRSVPTEISAAFESAGHPFKTITSSSIREYLKKLTTSLGKPVAQIPRASLQQTEWIVELLKFCLSDGHTDLRDLPLALLQDGTLHRFGQAPSGWIYRATSLEKELFSRFPQWFLDSEVEAVLPASEVKGVTAFTVELVVQRLVELDWWQKASQGNGYLWEPDGAGTDLPNSAWLSLLYKYLATAPSPLPGSMKEVPFVPGLDNYLYQGGYTTTPLWSATSSIRKKDQDALNYFGIPIVSTHSIPKNLFEDFFNHHPKNSLIFNLTPLDVIDTLETYAENHELPSYDEQQYRGLLNYINTAALNQLKEDKGRQAKLKHLPIFPTTDGELVALEHEDYKVGVPEAELPPCELRIKLLDGGSQWKYLFEILGVKRLSLDILIQDHILPAYPNLNTDKQLKIMEWLQSALPTALSDLRSQRANDSRLKEAVKNAPLIKCTDGKLRSATKTYRPGTPNVLEVLGKNAALPDMESVYKGDPDSWLALFQCLGIQDKLQAQDLIDRINQLREELRNSSMDAVTDPCLRLLKYVEENWSQLQQQQVKVGSASMKFQEAIQYVQWLPVVTDPHELAKYPGAKQPAKQLYKSSDVLCFRDANIAASQGFKILPRESLPAKTKEEMGFHSPSFDQATAHLEQLIRIWESGSEKSLPNFDTAVKKVYQYLNSFLNPNLSQKETYKRKLREKFNSKKCIWDGKGHFWKAEYVFTQKIQKLFGKHRFNCGEFNLYLALGQRKNVSWEDCNNFLSEIAIRYPNGITEQNKDAKADLQCVQHTLKHMISLMKQRKELSFILTEDNHLRPPNEVWLPDIKRYVEPVQNLGKVSLLHPTVDQKFGIAVGCNSLKKAREDKGTDMLLSREAKAKVQAERWQKQLQTSQFWEGLERLVRHEDKISPNDRFDVSWLKDFQIQVAEQVKTNLYWDTSKLSKLIAKDVPVNSYCDREAKVIYILYAPDVGSEFLAECLNGLLEKFALDNEICLVSIFDKESDQIHNYLDQRGIQSLPKSKEEKYEELEEAAPVDFQESGTEPADPSTQTGKETIPPTQPSKSPATQSILDVPSPAGKSTANTSSKSDREANQAESETDSDKARENGSSYQGNSSDRRNASRSPYSNRPHSSGNNRTGQHTTDTQPRPQTTSNSSKSSQGGGFSADTRVRAQREIEPSESEQLTQEKRREVGNKGVEIVLQYELEQGRTPVEMDQLWYNNPGYDIESTEQDEPDFDSRWCESRGTDGSIRYIEVKSFKGEWPRGGAKLSRRQFLFGLDAGEQFWLYVVEYVETPGKRKIHCIPNAAQETKSFYFDPGWKEVAQHFGEVWEE